MSEKFHVDSEMGQRIKIADLTSLLDRAAEIIQNSREGVKWGMRGEENTKEWFEYADQFAADYAKMKEKQ